MEKRKKKIMDLLSKLPEDPYPDVPIRFGELVLIRKRDRRMNHEDTRINKIERRRQL